MIYYLMVHRNKITFHNRKNNKPVRLTLGTKERTKHFAENLIQQEDTDSFIKIGEKHSFYILNINAFKKPRIAVTEKDGNCLVFECYNPNIKPIAVKVRGMDLGELMELHSSLCLDFDI